MLQVSVGLCRRRRQPSQVIMLHMRTSPHDLSSMRAHVLFIYIHKRTKPRTDKGRHTHTTATATSTAATSSSRRHFPQPAERVFESATPPPTLSLPPVKQIKQTQTLRRCVCVRVCALVWMCACVPARPTDNKTATHARTCCLSARSGCRGWC